MNFCSSNKQQADTLCSRIRAWLCPAAILFLNPFFAFEAGAQVTRPRLSESSASVAPADQATPAQRTSSQAVSDTVVVISPLNSEFVYLINSRGDILHQWKFDAGGSNAYLFSDGTLMRSALVPETDLYDGRGSFGRIQKVDWDGKLLWDFKYANDKHLQHHDFELLPNGNILLIAWEKLTKEQALSAGRDPAKLTADELYSEKIVEIEPQGLSGGKEVWVWRLWDHLVQNHDSQKPNFGEPSQNPRRVDVNFIRSDRADWIHMNAIDYHPKWNQIVLSARYLDELWIIDHSTTTDEAAGSSGGNYSVGGDLLYRMGNPMTYGQAALEDKTLFGQHNCMWVPVGFPGEGNITIFNNGTSAPREGYSSADEFRLPVDAAGVYRMTESGAFAAPETVWSYSRGEEMFSFRISGAERLANGNTLVCSGDQPWILEVTPDKQVVWETRHRYGGADGNTPNDEKGAMFRAPGYALDYFQPAIRQQLE